MENACIDTDILINILRGDPASIAFLSNSDRMLVTTYINLFELYFGSSKRGDFEKIEELQKKLVHLNLSLEIVREAGRIGAELEKQGNRLEVRDLLIGVTALHHGCTLKTNNKKHFERIKGLKLV